MNGKLNSALLLLDRALAEIETGFIPCARCGDQEDTKNLDFVDDLKAAKLELLGLVNSDSFEIAEAKKIHSVVISVAMSLQGIGEATPEQVKAFKGFTLIEILNANKVMEGYREEQENGKGHTVYITATERSLADAYIRVNNPEFLAANEFEDICTAMNNYNEDTENGHCVLIDSDGYYSLGELSSSGEDINKTLIVEHSPIALYKFVCDLLDADSESE